MSRKEKSLSSSSVHRISYNFVVFGLYFPSPGTYSLDLFQVVSVLAVRLRLGLLGLGLGSSLLLVLIGLKLGWGTENSACQVYFIRPGGKITPSDY